MRILQVATSMTSGGAEALVRDLCLELAAQGHSVALCLVCDAQSLQLDSEFEAEQKARLTAGGVGIHQLGAECRRRPWLGALRLRKLVEQFRPDIVHTHTIWGAAFGALGRLRQPILFTQHTNRLKCAWVHRLWLRRWIEQYIAICQDALEDMEAQLRLGTSRLTRIHNGIELRRFPVRCTPADHSPKIFVAIGRLTASKNYEMLLSAFSALLESLPQEHGKEVRLQIIGEGELASSLREQVEGSGLRQNVNFHGLCDDIPGLLAKADVYVMASRYEGLSISLIEAVATGLPIVATDVGGNREVLDDGKAGRLVPVDQDTFAAALSEVITSSELRRRLVRGCLRQRDRFSIERCAQQYLELYVGHIPEV